MTPRARKIAELRQRLLRGERLVHPEQRWAYKHMSIVTAAVATTSHGRPTEGGGGNAPPGSPDALHIWELSDANGTTIVDSGSGTASDGAASSGSALEYGLGGLTSSGAGSIGFPQSGYLQIPNAADMRNDEWTISGLFQADVLDAGVQMVIVAMDGGLIEGGFVIDLFADGIYAYTRKPGGSFGSAWWLGTDGSSGSRPASPIATVVAETAYRFMLTVDSGGAAFWLWEDGNAEPGSALATSGNTQGLANNTSDLFIGAYNAGAAPFNGVISQISFWNGACGSTELGVTPLGGPSSIAHSDPGGGRTFTLESALNQITTYKNLGLHGGTADAAIQLSDGGDAVYDMRGTTIYCDMTDYSADANGDGTNEFYQAGSFGPPPAGNASHPWTDHYNDGGKEVQFGANHDGGGLYGATFINGYGGSGGNTVLADALAFKPFVNTGTGTRYGRDEASRRYPAGGNHGGILIFSNGRTINNFTVEGCRFHNCWDPIRFSIGGASTTNMKNIRIYRCWFSKSYDDTVENDTFGEIIIEECLEESGYAWLSEVGNDNDDVPGRVTTVKNCLVRLTRKYLDNWQYVFSKMNEFANLQTWQNNVFCCQGGSNTKGGNGDPFLNIKADNGAKPPKYAAATGPSGDHRLNCSGNQVIWIGRAQYGSLPWTLPGGFTELDVSDPSHTAAQRDAENLAYWDDLVANWKSLNSHVPRISGVDT